MKNKIPTKKASISNAFLLKSKTKVTQINLEHKKNNLEGEVILPSSKSISNRLLIINALSNHNIEIKNLSTARDTRTLHALLQQKDNEKNVLDAGTAMRFLTAYYGVTAKESMILKGTERMHKRPIAILVNALNSIGANITYLGEEGYPPLKINPPTDLSAHEIEMNSTVSSQYISALLMVAPYLPHGLVVKLKGQVASKPYIEMTLKLMKNFGASIQKKEAAIAIENGKYNQGVHTVESDWSAASYWYAFLVLANTGKMMLKGLQANSLQGDAITALLFTSLGIETNYLPEGVELQKIEQETPKELSIDFSDFPDLAQTIAVVCAVKGIKLTMTGVESLKIKETDRLKALQTELYKIGVRLEENGQEYIVWGKEIHQLPEELTIKTYEDHRMAMAFAPLSLFGEIAFDDKTVVNKSYPEIWNEIKKISS